MSKPPTKEMLLRFHLATPDPGRDPERSQRLFRLQMEIQALHQFITDLPSFPKTSEVILREELILAVRGTTAIEGNPLNLDEISTVLDRERRSAELNRAEQEVVNSRKVYEFVQEFVAGKPDAPFTEALIKQLHTITTRGIDYPGNRPGAYRTTEVTFGIPRKPSLLQTESEVREAMEGFVLWLNDPGRGNFMGFPLVRANLAHYYLTEIHPFIDGNGRTARALEALILLRNGFHYCFWSLANFFARNRNEYLRQLRLVRESGDAADFLEFSASGYQEELTRIKASALDKLRRLMFMDYVHYLHREKKRQKVKINDRIVSLLDILSKQGRPPFAKFIADPSVQGLYSSVSPETRRRDWHKMLKLGLILITKENDVDFVGLDYRILEQLRYRA